MKVFKPCVIVNGKTIEYPTYQRIRSQLKNLIEGSSDGIVYVYRSRRGEWGQWFEHWAFNHKRKPILIKEGWM